MPGAGSQPCQGPISNGAIRPGSRGAFGGKVRGRGIRLLRGAARRARSRGYAAESGRRICADRASPAGDRDVPARAGTESTQPERAAQPRADLHEDQVVYRCDGGLSKNGPRGSYKPARARYSSALSAVRRVHEAKPDGRGTPRVRWTLGALESGGRKFGAVQDP